MSRSIYLDNSFITKPSPQALSKMMPYLSDYWGDFSQPNRKGQELAPGVQEAYKSLYSLFNASDEDTVLLTSSGAEAVTQVFMSAYLTESLENGKNHFVVSQADEAPALMACLRLEKLGGVSTRIQPDAKGIVTPQKVVEALSPRTALLSLSWGHGLTGVVQPLAEIATILKERGVKFHVEASHAVGRLAVDLQEIGADFVSIGGDLIHAPKGTGALWIKRGQKIEPLINGGLQQAGLRGAPLDVAGLISLAAAADEMRESRDFISTEGARLRNKLEKGILAQIPKAKVLFREQERLPHVSCITFEGCPSEALLFYLNQDLVLCSMGGGNLQNVGYVLESCQVPLKEASCALSFSLSRETTDDEIDRTIEIVKAAVTKLAKVSEAL